jgi:hypothetical protein
MQLTATLVQKLPLQSGAGKNGTWKKQEIIVETEGQYPKKVCVSLWGDKAELPMEIGQKLKIDFDVESREYNGRWYTDVKAWKVEVAGGAAPKVGSDVPPPNYPEFGEPALPEGTDDLPF